MKAQKVNFKGRAPLTILLILLDCDSRFVLNSIVIIGMDIICIILTIRMDIIYDMHLNGNLRFVCLTKVCLLHGPAARTQQYNDSKITARLFSLLISYWI